MSTRVGLLYYSLAILEKPVGYLSYFSLGNGGPVTRTPTEFRSCCHWVPLTVVILRAFYQRFPRQAANVVYIFRFLF